MSNSHGRRGSVHNHTKKHLKVCWACRAEKRLSDRMHVLAHTSEVLAVTALVLWVAWSLLFGGGY